MLISCHSLVFICYSILMRYLMVYQARYLDEVNTLCMFVHTASQA